MALLERSAGEGRRGKGREGERRGGNGGDCGWEQVRLCELDDGVVGEVLFVVVSLSEDAVRGVEEHACEHQQHPLELLDDRQPRQDEGEAEHDCGDQAPLENARLCRGGGLEVVEDE